MATSSTSGARDEPRIVLGIDYGTTCTGIAWLSVSGNPGQGPKIDSVNVFEAWPRLNSKKVPSAISYSLNQNGRRQWGHDIEDNSEVMRWTKLELEPRKRKDELASLLETLKGLELMDRLLSDDNAGLKHKVPRHLGKEPGDIVKDFLKKVAREWHGAMMEQGQNVLANVPLDIVITHPAVWSYQAKNQTVRAVLGAFNKGLFPLLRNVSLCSEPEACALFTVQDTQKRDRYRLVPGDCFVVCDAGGGTVDLVAYRVKAIFPLELEQVGGATGAMCGATQIDRAFFRWLGNILEPLDTEPNDFGTGGHFVLKAQGRILLDRFQAVKHAFDGNITGQLTLPRNIQVRPTGKSAVLQGVLQIPSEDLRSMFDECVVLIKDLIARQIAQAEATGHGGNTVTNIFLSGGFAESPYLLDQVRRWARPRNIEVENGKDSWSSVAIGAVLKGCETTGAGGAGHVATCPRNYGISVSEAFADHKHSAASDEVGEGMHGGRVAHGQMAWLARVGDLVPADEAVACAYDICVGFTKKHLDKGKAVQIAFVATGEAEPPMRLADVGKGDGTVVRYLNIDLSQIPGEQRQKVRNPHGMGSFYRAFMTVQLRIPPGDTKFSMVSALVTCGGNQMAYCEMPL